METFPALSETYILWHMAELLRDGVELTIYPAQRGDDTKVHEEVTQLGMLDLVRAPSLLPPTSDKAALMAHVAGLIVKSLARQPLPTLRLAAQTRGVENMGWIQAAQFMAELEKPERFDILHGYFGPPARRAALLRQIGAVDAGALVASFLGFDLNVLGQRLGGQYYARIFERAERISVSSRFMLGKLLELGAPEERVVILPLGLPTSRFNFTARHAPQEGPVKVVTAARLTEVKGITYGLDAIALAKAKGAHVRWDILGDGPLRAELQEKASRLKLDDEVIFHGAQPMTYVRQLLDQAHLSMLPGVRASDGAEEALGGAVIEAQAAGLPVLTTDAGGIAEGMRDGVSGICVPQKDPEALAQGLLTLISQADQWPTMGQAGREHVYQSYDSHKLHERWIALYRSLGA